MQMPRVQSKFEAKFVAEEGIKASGTCKNLVHNLNLSGILGVMCVNLLII